MVSLFDSLRKPAAADKDSIPAIIKNLLHRSGDGIVKIAPGIAKRILEETNFEGQRPIRQARVNDHLGRLEAGRWQPSFAISFAALPDGTLILVDGQHRLSAIIEFDAPAPVRVLLHEVASEEDARSLYIGFDASVSVRTTGEVLDAVQLGGSLNIKKNVRNAIYRALVLLNNNFEHARSNMLTSAMTTGQDIRINQFKDWEPQAVRWNEIYSVADRSHSRSLLTAGATAVGLYTLKHQPAKAYEFWRGIAANDGLKKLDPRHTLIQDFHTRVLNAGSARQSVQAPVLAWNAFYEGRTLKIIKCIEGAEIRIAGTPFANGPTGVK
jgi:hypothetical protein